MPYDLHKKYPKIVVLDFETTSGADLKKTGAWRYAEDPSTDYICLGIYFSNGKGGEEHHVIFHPGFVEGASGFAGDLEREAFRGVEDMLLKADLVIGHNIEFEMAIWENVLHRRGRVRMPFPRLKAYCTMGAAAAAGLPLGLSGACKMAGLGVEDQKNEDGKALIRSMCSTPIDLLAARVGIQAQLAAMGDYCMQDVRAEYALANAIPAVHAHELEVFRQHLLVNARGFAVDRDLQVSMEKMIEQESETVAWNLAVETQNEIGFEDITKVAFIVDWIGKKLGEEVPDLTAATVKALLTRPDLPPVVKAVLEARQKIGKASTAKLDAVTATTCKDGRIRGALFYHGASTGRWSGRGCQPHNFPRPNIKDPDGLLLSAFKKGDVALVRELSKGNVWDGVASCLRSLLIPGPGLKMFCADFSAIEARVAFWLAMDAEGLAVYAAQDAGTGPDLYRVMAGKIYGIDPKTVTKEQRQVGKAACLGLQYGMGVDKFVEYCTMMGMPGITRDFAERTVRAYRRLFSGIPKFWENLEQAIKSSLLRPDTLIRLDSLKIWTKTADQTTYLQLPSGRHISYRTLEATRNGLQYHGTVIGDKWAPKKVWGGLLVENVVQAVARDLMAEAMLRLEGAGFRIILTVHDEILAEAVENEKHTAERFVALMAEKPSWPGVETLPLNAEGWVGDCWKK